MSNTVQAGAEGLPIFIPEADVARAKAIVFTVWLAMTAHDFDSDADGHMVADTLYEAFECLARAVKAVGEEQ